MTQEEQYKQETGKEPKYWFDNDTYYNYTDDFIYWLKRKADLADAEKARREAAERYLKCFIEYHDIDSFKASISPGMMSKYYQETGKEPKYWFDKYWFDNDTYYTDKASISPGMMSKYYSEWQDAITAYDKAVGGKR